MKVFHFFFYEDLQGTNLILLFHWSLASKLKLSPRSAAQTTLLSSKVYSGSKWTIWITAAARTTPATSWEGSFTGSPGSESRQRIAHPGGLFDLTSGRDIAADPRLSVQEWGEFHNPVCPLDIILFMEARALDRTAHSMSWVYTHFGLWTATLWHVL